MVRSITSQDFDFIFGLYMHPSVNPYLLYETCTKEEFNPIFDDLLSKNIIFIYSENNQDVGMFKLIPLLHRNWHINYIGGLAIHPDFAGKGYGALMMQEIIKIGQERGLKRLELSTATFNTAAIKLYEKCGFKTEGVLRNYTHLKSEARYIDEQMMAYLYK